ncbi:MAG: hypothetical protein ACRDJX_04630 [Solirubrobacteraceae bacterium]
MRLRRQTADASADQAAPAEVPGRREPAEYVRQREPAQPEYGRTEAAGAPEPQRAPGHRSRAYARTRNAGAAAVGTAGAGVLLIARLVMAVASLIALLILLAIVLRDVDANASNSIVNGIHQGANFFAGAFTGLISFNDHPKRAITIDWGIALLVYLIVGGFIASVIARIGRGGVRFERSHRTVSAP